MQTRAEVEIAIAHARSLFGSGEAIDVRDSAESVTQAVHAVNAEYVA